MASSFFRRIFSCFGRSLYPPFDSTNSSLTGDLPKPRLLLGDLSDYCNRHAPLTEQQIWPIIRQAASAFSYKHRKNIVHGDIKLDNILYTDRGVLKVTDFGFSSAFKPGALVYGKQGTHGYMAPEIYSANGYNGPPVDVWALGVVLHLLINNKFPFSRKTMKKIVSGKLPFNFEPPTSAGNKCAELLKSMLCMDPMKRISMKEILVHPFIKTKSHGPSKRTCDRESADSGPSKRLCKSKGSSQNIKSHEDKKSKEEIMVEPGKKNKIPGPNKRG